MKQYTVLLNIVLALGLAAIGPAPSITAAAQGPGGIVHDGSGGYQMRPTSTGEAPALAEQVSAVQQVPPYMRLTFMSNSAGNWDIYDYKWEGAVTTPLTSSSGGDYTPRAAPGGGRVAFYSDRDGNEEIYVVDFDGMNERRLTNNEYSDSYPSWSPSGTRIVFTSDRDGNEEIYVMDDDGSDVTRLTYDDGADWCPAYSPDGKKIAFVSDRSGNDDIWVMNVDGTGLTNLSDSPGDDWYPGWSPDGTQVAFSSWRTGDGEIWVQAVAGGAPVNLTNNPANDWSPAWSPDGQWIVFSSNRTGDEEAFLMPAGGGAASNVSNNPAANDRYPDFFWPRIVAQGALSAQGSLSPQAGGLPWQQASTWLPPGAPGRQDLVWIQNGAHVTITDGPPTGPRKVVADLTVFGTLDGNCDVPIEAPRDIFVGGTGLIEAGNQWYSKKGCQVDLDSWPDGTITVDGIVRGGPGQSTALDRDGGSVDLLARSVDISSGLVRGGNGGSLPARGGLYGLTWNRGGKGGSVTIRGEYITIGVNANVRGGAGGDTDPTWTDTTCNDYPQHGGDGGPVFLGSGALASYGGTRDLTVLGKVYGGQGGNVIGTHSGRGGRGGDVKLNVQWGVWGELLIGNLGQLSGGNGGGRPLVVDPNTGRLVPQMFGRPVWGGNGGDVITLVSLSTTVNGMLNAPLNPADPRGARGRGEEATCCGPSIPLCGADGFRGDVTTHPPSITVASTARESGRNVWIYGAEGWGIDLSQVQAGAITATESITVAVGSGGQIDLRGHGVGEDVLSAGQGVFLYADPGQILLDPGISVVDITDPPAQVGPARVIHRALLHAEGDAAVVAGATAVISLSLTNAGSGADTFQLAVADTEGWTWQVSPASVSLDSMAEDVAVASAAVPSGAVGALNDVTFSAQSTADPSQVTEITLPMRVIEILQAYLPLVVRQFVPESIPGPIYFDDFSDPNSGWPVGDYGSVVVDYDNENYRVLLKEDNKFVWVSLSSLTYDDCTVEVEAWRSTGGNSTYGIVFGLDASVEDFYAFTVQPYDQEYALWRRDGGTWVTLIPYTDSSHINYNMAHNRLKVTREGAQIRLYVNDHYLASYTDSTYTGTRRVGIYAASGPESPVWLRYDDFTVWGTETGTMSPNAGSTHEVGVIAVPPD